MFLSNYPIVPGDIIRSASFVNYKKGCTRLAAASDKVYRLLAQGRWFSPASSTIKTGLHDIAEILLKVALNTKIQIQIHSLCSQCFGSDMVYLIYLCLEFTVHTLFKITKPKDINRSTKTTEAT